MFDFEAIVRRHAAGAPAREDIPDLIAEVERLQAQPPVVPPKSVKPPKEKKD
jgi:hypothetical protein